MRIKTGAVEQTADIRASQPRAHSDTPLRSPGLQALPKTEFQWHAGPDTLVRRGLGGLRIQPLPRAEVTAATHEAQKVIRGNSFEVNRGLEEYFDHFGPDFENLITGLGSSGHIIDSGSGETLAMAQYLGINDRMTAEKTRSGLDNAAASTTVIELANKPPSHKAKVTAITVEMNVDKAQQYRACEQLNLLTGRFFEDIPDAQLKGQFGQANAVVDFWGVFAYTPDPSAVLGRYLNNLRDDGAIFLKVGPRVYSRTSGMGKKKESSSNHRSKVTRANGDIMSLPDWLQTIPGISVSSVGKADAALKIEILDRDKIVIPHLELLEVQDSSNPPPGRILRE